MTLYVVSINGETVGTTALEYEAVLACLRYAELGYVSSYEAWP